MSMYDEISNVSDESITFLLTSTDTQQISGIYDGNMLPFHHFADLELESLDGHDSATKDDDQLKVTRAKEASRRRMYRQILRSQRNELRQQVARLSHEVSRIKQMKEMEKAKFDAQQTSEFWFWKSTAAQQHHQRRLVEREHEVLKRAVDIQTTYINSLEIVRQEGGGSPISPTCLHEKEWSEDVEIPSFEELLQDLDVDLSNDQDPQLELSS